MEFKDNKPNRPAYEWIVAVLVVVLVVGAVGMKYHFNKESAMERILIAELKAVRTAISLYIVTNRQPPASLEKLITENVVINGSSRPYLSKEIPLREGVFLDPFGIPYHYNARTGWVNSEADGYKDW